jgi:outer membrane protein assembly factor BamB
VPAALKRSLALLCLGLATAACAGRGPLPPAPLFPLARVWRAELEDYVVSPLAAGARRLYVATRDGRVTAFDQVSGTTQWTIEDRPGHLTATRGRLLLRQADGTVWSLKPRDGTPRWTTETGVVGELPVVLDGDRLYVAGDGLAALDVETGRVLWTLATVSEVTAAPVPTTSRLLTGEADGILYCRDRATGLPLWGVRTAGPLLAPPLVDEGRRRVYLGTTERTIREVKLDKGQEGWTWRVGADIQSPGLLLPDRVLFASFDAVLYGLTRGGNLAWRTPLPSRPLSGPLLVEGHIVIACHENEILGFRLKSGESAGTLRTDAQIRTPPLVEGGRIFVGLRDRSVVAFALPPEGPPTSPLAASPPEVVSSPDE